MLWRSVYEFLCRVSGFLECYYRHMSRDEPMGQRAAVEPFVSKLANRLLIGALVAALAGWWGSVLVAALLIFTGAISVI